ncbi:MAG: adenylyl-sulfate kinase [Longimicrobiales bacterium]
MPKSKNIYWEKGEITRGDRERFHGHKGAILWFTGLSGSGKSTLARAVEEKLFENGCHTYVLDGDNVRHGLNGDLGFSPEDRTENIRRIGQVAKLFVDAGSIVLTAFISPYREDRDANRAIMNDGEFVEVFVDAPLETCEERDPKGLYEKARSGEIANFTGIDAPYEEPLHPEVVVKTGEQTIEESVEQILDWLAANGYLARLNDTKAKAEARR